MGARGLADDLRGRSDDALAALLVARPDLASPPPADIDVLAARAGVRASVTWTVDRLDRLHLGALDALALLGGGTAEEVATLLPASKRALTAALTRLHDLALVWRDGPAFRLTSGVADVLGERPAGLGRPVAELTRRAGLPTPDVAALLDVVRDLPADERDALGQVDAGGGLGAVRDAGRREAFDPLAPPVRRLLARGVLVPVDASTVEVPREVGLALRGDAPLGPGAWAAPRVETRSPGPGLVDAAAAQQAGAAVAAVEELLERWGANPPAVLRAGGVGVRDLRASARVLQLDEHETALMIEVAQAAGLLDATSGLDPVWLPTPAFDGWVERPAAERWTVLALAWLSLGRLPGLVGTKDDRDRLLAALGPGIEAQQVRAVRREVLAVLAQAPPGSAIPPAGLQAFLDWSAPRHGGRSRATLVTWTLREAAALGVTGRDGLGGPARALVGEDDPARAAELLTDLLPAPVDHVLLQADLTAVAPGPLLPDLAREMALLADVESTGGATVYRFTEQSLRRGLDAGRSADDLHGFLRSVARAGVPQALTYLVDDIARRHGVLRVGSAATYLRCDDPALISQVEADRHTRPVDFRRLAPTVLVSRISAKRVLEVLRDAGYAPVAEGPDGVVRLSRPDVRRTPARPRPHRAGLRALDPAGAADVVRAVRAGDRAAHAGRRAGEAALRRGDRSPAATLALLHAAVRDGHRVWLGYVNAQGSASERIVAPLVVDGGYLVAYDHRSDERRMFALHRITGVAAVDDEERAAAGGG